MIKNLFEKLNLPTIKATKYELLYYFTTFAVNMKVQTRLHKSIYIDIIDEIPSKQTKVIV